jgi:TPR repeat protein
MYNEAVRGSGVCAILFATLAFAFAGCESKEQRLLTEWQEGCTAGDLEKCANLAESYAKGSGVAADPVKATTILRDACNRGGARGCLLLGDAYMNGSGVSKDTTQASSFYGKACDNGDEEGCVRACDTLNDAVRCLRVAVLSDQGAKDPKRAAVYLHKACDNGHPLGCKFLGERYRDGNGVKQDADLATEFLRRADALLRTACSGATKPDYCDL